MLALRPKAQPSVCQEASAFLTLLTDNRAMNEEKVSKIVCSHKVLRGGPWEGGNFTFRSAPDPFFKASNKPCLALRIATP